MVVVANGDTSQKQREQWSRHDAVVPDNNQSCEISPAAWTAETKRRPRRAVVTITHTHTAGAPRRGARVAVERRRGADCRGARHTCSLSLARSDGALAARRTTDRIVIGRLVAVRRRHAIARAIVFSLPPVAHRPALRTPPARRPCPRRA